MKTKFSLLIAILVLGSASVFAQLTLPRASQRQNISQTVGDTQIALVYDRPNVKARQIWGCQTTDVIPKGETTYPCLVPYGQVWRTGADENTTFEVTNDVKINGQTLPAGKYGLHTIPGKDEWIVIFNKVNDAWGSFSYKQENDQLRVKAKPQTADFQETMSLGFENVKPNAADVVIRWEKMRVPFTVDVGDVSGRVFNNIRKQIVAAKADDFRTPATGASWVFNEKMTANYPEALTWIDKSLAIRETFGGLNLKAQMLAASGKKAEAIATAEKAIQVGKAATPAVDTGNLEKMVREWKSSQ